MPDPRYPGLEARRRAEVERSVAPYRGKVPDFVLAKLYELAERYWTENPIAARILEIQEAKPPARSGVEASDAEAIQAAIDAVDATERKVGS